MIPKPLKPFIERLSKETEDGNLLWTEGPEGISYIISMKDATIHLGSKHGEDFELGISRRDRHAYFTVSKGESDYALMSNLFSHAMQSAVDMGSLIEGLFD